MAASVFMTWTSLPERLMVVGFRPLAVDPVRPQPQIHFSRATPVMVVVDAFLPAVERRLLDPIRLIREVALQLEDFEVALVVVAHRHAMLVGDRPRHVPAPVGIDLLLQLPPDADVVED